MKSSLSPFSRVRVSLCHAVTLLAMFALTNHTAHATAVPTNPTFTGTTPTYGSNADYSHAGGTLSSSFLTIGSNNVTGISYGSATAISFNQATSALPLTDTGSFTAVTIDGTNKASGSFTTASAVFSGHYHFSLASTTQATITSWTLTYTVYTQSGGSYTGNASGNLPVNGQDIIGTVQFPVSSTASLTGYKATLDLNYAVAAGTGTMLSANIPAGSSIDFNFVPEPGTWAILGLGIAGAAVQGMRARRRRMA